MLQLEQAGDFHDAGIDAFRAGEYDEALKAFALARSLFAQAGDLTGEAEALGSMGAVSIELEEWDQAEQYMQQALSICEEQGDLSNQGKILGNLGMMHARQGDVEQAAKAYEQAIVIFQETGERGFEKDVARQLSKLKLKKGKFLDALGDYQPGLEDVAEASGAQGMVQKLFRLFGRGEGGPEDEDVGAEESGAIEFEGSSEMDQS